MNEDKVKEAYELLGNALTLGKVLEARSLLEEAIAPEQPEIPDGCPVLMFNDEPNFKKATFYGCKDGDIHISIDGNDYTYAEIDYTRKGHVIPWHGGECPVDEDDTVHVIFKSKASTCGDGMHTLRWKHKGNKGDIIAYCIWPEWACNSTAKE